MFGKLYIGMKWLTGKFKITNALGIKIWHSSFKRMQKKEIHDFWSWISNNNNNNNNDNNNNNNPP